MTLNFGRIVRTAALGVSVMAAGCGSVADSSFSPTGPSSPGGSAAGATIFGTVNAGAMALSALSAPDALAPAASRAPITITVSGTNISAATDGSGRFTLTGIPAGDVQLTFSGAGNNATITIAGVTPDDRIEIQVRVNGREGRIEQERRQNNGRGVEVNGRISSIDDTARTFLVGTQLVSVPETAVIRHGNRILRFIDLDTGDHVQVKGTRETDRVVASEVKVEQGGRDDDDDDEDAEVRGAVAGLTGTCPALTFTIGTAPATTVTTNDQTEFDGIACSAIVNGSVLKVEGIRQSNGSILATEVKLETDAEVEGVVAGLTGTCPALTFTVGTAPNTTSVTTDASTAFLDVTCAALANGAEVEVEGTRQANGSILATEVELED